ncbi:MAG: Regulator of sigma-W protease RasP [Anaerolineales bacterium]|nr:Regulator of sigma-W protease RasP [Anaerolineales bacterium]
MFGFLSGWWWLAAIPVLGVLVFVHELGHFLAARWMNVEVEEFGFGYPPRLATLFERNGVKYTINLLPLGGFVRMVGEEGDFNKEGSLYRKQPWQRTVVLLAGPIANLLFASIVMAVVLFALGTPTNTGDVIIQQVSPNSPAAEAGLEQDDVLRAIAGQPLNSLDAVTEITTQHLGQETEVAIERDGEAFRHEILFRPPEKRPADQGAMGIVISLDEELEPVSAAEAAVRGPLMTVQLFLVTLVGFADLLAKLLTGGGAPAGGVAGPIGIVQITGQFAQLGLYELLYFTGFLSINLALLNLFPVPALDGGRLVFVVVEWIRGKRIPPEREAVVHFIGFVLLIGLMVVVSYFDIARWLSGQPLPIGGG